MPESDATTTPLPEKYAATRKKPTGDSRLPPGD